MVIDWLISSMQPKYETVYRCVCTGNLSPPLPMVLVSDQNLPESSSTLPWLYDCIFHDRDISNIVFFQELALDTADIV